MTQKLAFELRDGKAPGEFLLKLTQRDEMAQLTRAEGFDRPFDIAPLRLIFDEGNGELVLAEGFEDQTPSGRIAMRILAATYCDALEHIMAQKNCAQDDEHPVLRSYVFA